MSAVGASHDVKCVEDEHVMIVLSQSDNIALAGNLEAATARDLNVGTLELTDQSSASVENNHMKPISVRVADQNVTGVRDVYAVWEGSEAFTTDFAHILALIVEDDHTVTFEVAYVVLVIIDRYVWGLSHVFRTVEPSEKISRFSDHEDCWRHWVYGNDVSVGSDGQTGDYIDVTDGDFAHKMTRTGEDLHSTALSTAIADYITWCGIYTTSARSDYGHLTSNRPLSTSLSNRAE